MTYRIKQLDDNVFYIQEKHLERYSFKENPIKFFLNKKKKTWHNAMRKDKCGYYIFEIYKTLDEAKKRLKQLESYPKYHYLNTTLSSSE